ncbi:MAG: hypothetical protein KJ601_03510, partial [Nanoarchaeota archaeon]|nr:hypothetical protein [Nanoarchaeota archaeon]
VVSMHIIENDILIRNLDDFKAQLEKFKDKLKDFWTEFYVQRSILQKDMDLWFSIEKSFPKIIEAVNKLKADFTVIILTNKNTDAVYPSCKHFGLHIEKEDIFDTSLGNDKKKKFEMIHDKYKVDYKDILFVDDILENLTTTMPLGIKPFFAVWFNKNKEHHKMAQDLKIPLLTEDNFYSEITKLR